MELDIFGFQFGKKQKQDTVKKEEIALQSFAAAEQFDGTTTIEAGGVFGTSWDYSNPRDESSYTIQYRNMSTFPEMDNAIDEIVNAAIVPGSEKKPVKLDLENLPLSDSIKSKIYREFDVVMQLLDFNHKGYEIFRRWYIDARLFYNIVIDKDLPNEGIKEIVPIDPLKIKKVRKVTKDAQRIDNTTIPIIKEIEDYYLYTNNDKEGYVLTGPGGIKLSTDSIVYCPSGLIDLNSKRVLGYMHKAIRPLNMLRQLEDALLVYRIARAPERRIFYVDVGQLPKQKAEQYMRDMMSRFRNQVTYNQATGEIRDQKNHLSVLEDYWIPRREGSRGTEISTLAGAQSTSQIEDVEYFKKKLYQCLNVPVSRLTSESTGFNMGRSVEITREEVKFYKFIERLRHQFSKLFTDFLRVQLILKGIITEEDWHELHNQLKIIYTTDNYFWDLKEAEILSERLKLLSAMEPLIGRYFSTEYIKRNVLHQSEQEIQLLEREMAIDKQRMQQEQMQQMMMQQQQQMMQQQGQQPQQ